MASLTVPMIEPVFGGEGLPMQPLRKMQAKAVMRRYVMLRCACKAMPPTSVAKGKDYVLEIFEDEGLDPLGESRKCLGDRTRPSF